MNLWNGFRDALDTVRTALSEASQQHEQPAYRSAALRQTMLRQYQAMSHPRVPLPFAPTPNTAILSLMIYSTVVGNGGLTRLPRGTQLLMAAICIPYIAPEGVCIMKWGLSPFMVWEHHQRYRLMSSAFLHMDLDHLLGNLNHLVVSGCYLESRMSTRRFAATVLSLTASSQALFVGLSWLECKWLGAWESYFLGNAIGFSGVCFGLQVIADNLRGGSVILGSSQLAIPSKFYCWLTLAVNQLLVPQASSAGHLCGIAAGLLHIYIPKTVQSLKSLVKKEDNEPRRPQRHARLQNGVLVDDRLQIAGRRVSDMVVHLVCFGVAMLARNLLRPHSKIRR